MPRVCPRPCGRLTTAAVFIAVGVVQLLVGTILLRSEFADLLSGPDFMIGSSNIGIGCVYGMAASVWKSKKKQRSSRRSARNNVLASFLVSIITVNATSVLILIMGDGNKLLFAYMEAVDRKSTAAFANEVLAGAYVTSVCSPIVCIVVAIVALSGSCFQAHGKPKHLEHALDVESPFGLVPNSQAHSRPKLISDCLAETPTTSSDQSSKFSEDSVFSEKDARPSRRQSSTYIPSPVSTWAHKRKHILRNSKSLKKRSRIFDASLLEPEMRQFSNQELIPRIRESSLLKESQNHVEDLTPPCCDSIKLAKEKRSNQSASVGTDSKETDSKYSHAVRKSQMSDHSSEVKFANSPGCSYRSESFESNEAKSDIVSSRNNSFEYFATQKSTPSDVNNPKDLALVDDLALRHAEMHLLEKINPTLMKLKEKTMQELKTRMQNIPSRMSSSEVTTQKQSSGGFKQSDLPAINSAKNLDAFQEASFPESKVTGNLEKGFSEKNGNNSDENVHRRKNGSMKLSSETLSLPGPSMSPCDTIKKNKTQRIHDRILNNIKSKTIDSPQNEHQLSDKSECPNKAITPSPICTDGKKKITNLVLDCPKVPSIKLQSRKRDVTKRMSSMASITEIPSEESAGDTNIDQNSAAQYKSSTSNDPRMLVKKDVNANITREQTDMLKSISPDTVERKKPSANSSIKNLLKGIWTSSGPEGKLNILELIMDEDSLIGLSEEDLISRTLRIRALRMAVAERLKNERERGDQMERAEDSTFTSP